MSARGFVRRVVPEGVRVWAWRWRERLRGRPPQLLMSYGRTSPPALPALPQGYTLRQWRPGDDAGWLAMLNASDTFGSWDAKRLEVEKRTLIPGGQWFALSGETLVAGAGMFRRRLDGDEVAELGWVVRDPRYKGSGLGRAVVAAALRSVMSVPPGKVILHTEDHRLTAIAMYLDMGWTPDETSHSSFAPRWEALRREIAGARD